MSWFGSLYRFEISTSFSRGDAFPPHRRQTLNAFHSLDWKSRRAKTRIRKIRKWGKYRKPSAAAAAHKIISMRWPFLAILTWPGSRSCWWPVARNVNMTEFDVKFASNLHRTREKAFKYRTKEVQEIYYRCRSLYYRWHKTLQTGLVNNNVELTIKS
jgi:hypothetical protein